MAGTREMKNARRLHDDVSNGPALPDIPVVVLTGMAIDPSPSMSDEEKHAFNAIKRDAHAAVVNSVPRSDQRVLPDAGHLFFAQKPDVVVEAIFDILDRAVSH